MIHLSSPAFLRKEAGAILQGRLGKMEKQVGESVEAKRSAGAAR